MTLLQAANPAPQPMHLDTHTTETLHRAIDAAQAEGFERGEYAGYMTGWRSGVACGACWGALLVCMAAGALRYVGWL